MTSQITNHQSLALARLKEQFKGQTKYIALLNALVSPVQDVEDATWQLYAERWIDTAEGDQLDNLGTIVGQLRVGLSDEDYRAYLRARIATNRSNGITEDLIRVARLIVNDLDCYVGIENQYPASVVVRLQNIAVSDETSDAAIAFLRAAKAAGVRIILEYETSLEPFTFGTSTFLDGLQNSGAISLTVDSTELFPDTGTLIIAEGETGEESRAYTGKTATTFTGLTATSNNHADNTAVTLDDGEDTGFGDTGDATVGGDFSGAKE